MFKSQRDELAALFISKPGVWIPLPEIQELGAAQYNARISELRGPKDANGKRTGMKIKNKTEDIVVAGQKVRNSWYMYIPQEKQMEI